MRRFIQLGMVIMLLGGLASDGFAGALPEWLQRAPLNTDTSLLGWHSPLGLARASRYLAYLSNLAVLAALLYSLAGREADFSNFFYAYFGSLIGGIVLALALNPVIGAFSLLPILALTIGLVYWLCDVPAGRAILIGLAYHAYQIVYILIFMGINAHMTGAA